MASLELSTWNLKNIFFMNFCTYKSRYMPKPNKLNSMHILTLFCTVFTDHLFALFFLFFFFFAEATASILGNPNVFIESGSVLNLTCVVKHAISKPAFIIWKHGTKVSKNLISLLCCTQGNLYTD